jgi:hypothetical protein
VAEASGFPRKDFMKDRCGQCRKVRELRWFGYARLCVPCREFRRIRAKLYREAIESRPWVFVRAPWLDKEYSHKVIA